MTTKLKDQEREAWNDAVRRLDFLLKAFEELDATSTDLAAKNLGKALSRYKVLYGQRVQEEFSPKDIPEK